MKAQGSIVSEFLIVLAVVLVIALIIYVAQGFNPVAMLMPEHNIGPSAEAVQKACAVFGWCK
jgi:hypothetical protein